MESMLDNQVVKLSCPHCTGTLSERLAGLKASALPGCIACETDIQIYADQLRAELTSIEQALAAHRRQIDQALTEHWRQIKRQGE